ncbi:bis-aminopropyl spermidine synthase family protein [Actinoallomurus soli]|uniref:bis-aminopropyl spermidine synthase family protein n=1 Tax=Actinoallomurus soli TaxID=2952535 RepID=UPI00209300C0|nr:bis-aminopropyl spermidine synthase family protein [Actinoallomurus soli]MCO5967310.1 bis-aminopropyl spermidine synthase family protein [Actinoallomurus soli]
MSEVPEEAARIVEGVGARRLRHALALLTGDRSWDADALVRATAAPRRAIDALLTALGDDLEDGRIRRDRADAYRPLAAPAVIADPVAHLLPDHAEIVAEMAALIAAAPRARTALDHVAATADTAVRRALLLGARFWLGSARLLCVGDHDLTSLAVALTHPGVEITVVDIDDRILEFIGEEAARRGLPIRCRFADLRLGLPPGAREWADLVFTDPPYTPDGVALFTRRGLEGLRDRDSGRVLVAYGASEGTPALALKVQEALGPLHLAYEAIWPDFNRYDGAPAIGSASDLYVLRPTSRTWKALGPAAAGTRIYTQGPQAVEAPERPLEAAVTEPADLLVGDWPKGFAPGTPRVHLATWLAKPYAGRTGDVVIALPAGYDALLPRVLLASRAERVRVLTPAVLPRSLKGVLSAVYHLKTAPGEIVASRIEAPGGTGAVLRHILDRPHNRIAGSWREGLIRHASGDLTKNQARARIQEAAPWLGDATVLDLPAHRLAGLPDAVRQALDA